MIPSRILRGCLSLFLPLLVSVKRRLLRHSLEFAFNLEIHEFSDVRMVFRAVISF